jgi:hypothetical protein
MISSRLCIGLVTSVALLLGCRTEPAAKHLSKDTNVCVLVKTDGLLYRQVLVGETAVQGVSKRIEGHIVNYLNKHGIQMVPEDALTTNDLKLTVKLKAVEMVAVRNLSPFAPTFPPVREFPLPRVMRQQPIIRYSAVLAGNGMTRFDYNYEQSDESLDKLTQLIGERIGERVGRFCK